MAQVDSRKAGKSYKKKTIGRKEKDGAEAVIKLETLRVRLHDLIALRIKSGQAAADYNDAVKAVAEASGLLSATVNKFVRARAGDNFLEDKAKAQQLALCFEELGPLDDDEPKADPKHPAELFGEGQRDHGADDEDDAEEEDEKETGATVTRGRGKERRGLRRSSRNVTAIRNSHKRRARDQRHAKGVACVRVLVIWADDGLREG
jgi:hypothetical protein